MQGLTQVVQGLIRVVQGLTQVVQGLTRVVQGLTRVVQGLTQFVQGLIRVALKSAIFITCDFTWNSDKIGLRIHLTFVVLNHDAREHILILCKHKYTNHDARKHILILCKHKYSNLEMIHFPSVLIPFCNLGNT